MPRSRIHDKEVVMPTRKYVRLTSTSSLHLIGKDHKTLCGRNYLRYDYVTYSENEFDSNAHALCHKCSGQRREGPRTIKEAFQPKYFLG